MSIVNKNNIIAFLISVTVLTVLFLAPKKITKYYPADETHLNAVKSTTKRKMHEACGVCHFEGGVMPIPKTHVKRERCYGCHSAKPAEVKQPQ